jgi:hypothetical protein
VVALAAAAAALAAEWTPVAPLTTARSRTGVVFFPANGFFYAIGGEATGGNRNIPIEEYDPETNEWTDRTPLATGVSNTGAARVGDFVFVPGGYTGTEASDDLQVFDPLGNSVSTGAPMPTGNYAHAVVARGQFVHVVGGSATGVAGTTHFVYSLASGTWSSKAPTPIALQYPGAASDGVYVYLFGGNTTNLANAYRYDPDGNSWTPVADLLEGRGGPAGFFCDGRIWAIGGGWSSYLDTTEFFDGTAWRQGPRLTNGARTAGAACGDLLALKAGGWDGTYSADVEVLALELFVDGFESGTTGEWSDAAP